VDREGAFDIGDLLNKLMILVLGIVVISGIILYKILSRKKRVSVYNFNEMFI